MSTKIERIEVTLPDGFDAARHLKALAKMIDDKHGEGWEIDHIDPVGHTATASRQAVVTEVSAVENGAKNSDGPQTRTVRLPRGTRPSDGEKVAARFADQYPGAYLTRFDPFLGSATITRLTDDEVRCRGAIANALGLARTPWEIQVRSRRGGGFHIELPKTYVPSKHDDKLDEVATSIVGREGWYVDIDAAKLTAAIIPSAPPTFPAMLEYPLNRLGKVPQSKLLIGRSLSERADKEGDDVYIDFEDGPHIQVSGTSGSGKTVLIHGMITGALASGAELAIIDLPFKAVDYTEFRPFVRPGGWGCAEATSVISAWLPEALTALGLVYDEGRRRAGLLDQHKVTKVSDLPKSAQVRPIFVVCDEVTGILQLDEVPKGLPKDHPLVVETNHTNLMRQMILNYMKRIAAELRFAGIRMVLASQVSSVNTGVPTSLRMNLAQKILQGTNPTEGNRKLSLADPGSVPVVPENVKADGKASKGVGVAELEGQPNVVYKSFFATPSTLVGALTRLQVPTTDRPRPTRREIDKYTPSLDDPDESTPPGRSNASGGYGYGQQSDAEFLRDFDKSAEGGFAKANAARRELDRTAGTARARKQEMTAAGPVTVTRVADRNNPFDQSAKPELCTSCGGAINAFTGECQKCSR